jgi:hypothetical protein
MLSPLHSLLLFSKTNTMTFSSKSSSSPAVPHHRYPFYSTCPQMTLVDALVMQAQAQALLNGDSFVTMPHRIGGDPVPSSSEGRDSLILAAMIAVLNEDTTPFHQNGNTGSSGESTDHPKSKDPHNSPNEPSAL